VYYKGLFLKDARMQQCLWVLD